MADCNCPPSCPPTVSTSKCKCNCTQKYGPQDLRMVLRVGTSPDYEPFEFIDANGELDGFEVELLTLIAKKLRFRVEWVPIDFDALQNLTPIVIKYIDIIASGMSPTPERELYGDFSNIFYESLNVIIRRDNVVINSLDDLNGKKIGAQKGSIQLDLLYELADTYNITIIDEYVSVEDLAEALDNGSDGLQAIILSKPVAKRFVNSIEKLMIVETIGDLSAEVIAFAFSKNSSMRLRINQVLEEFEADGTMDDLRQKWIEEN